MLNDLNENEIIISGYAVKYHDLEYCEKYIVLSQHRTRRRIPNGYFFEDTGIHIYISGFYSYLFQAKRRSKQFILNTVTKEWRECVSVIIEKHIPEKRMPVKTEADASLTK